jgi:hypothetical protein
VLGSYKYIGCFRLGGFVTHSYDTHKMRLKIPMLIYHPEILLFIENKAPRKLKDALKFFLN